MCACSLRMRRATHRARPVSTRLFTMACLRSSVQRPPPIFSPCKFMMASMPSSSPARAAPSQPFHTTRRGPLPPLPALRETTLISCPSRISAAATCRPTKPVPPRMRTCMLSPLCCAKPKCEPEARNRWVKPCMLQPTPVAAQYAIFLSLWPRVCLAGQRPAGQCV